MNKNHICTLCGKYHNRTVTVDAIIIKDNNILLIKRSASPFKDFWALPGGHIDLNENIDNTVKREVREETGLVCTNLVLLGIYSDPRRHPDQAVAVAYMAQTSGIAKAGSDASDCRYFPLDELPENLAFDHKSIISDYLEKYGNK